MTNPTLSRGRRNSKTSNMELFLQTCDEATKMGAVTIRDLHVCDPLGRRSTDRCCCSSEAQAGECQSCHRPWYPRCAPRRSHGRASWHWTESNTFNIDDLDRRLSIRFHNDNDIRYVTKMAMRMQCCQQLMYAVLYAYARDLSEKGLKNRQCFDGNGK